MLQRLWFPKNRSVKKIWQLLSVSVAAQLGVLPISLFYFHQFPALFFVSNLLVVPWLGLILGMGIFSIALSLLDLLPNWFVELYTRLIAIMNSIIEWVAQQEAFVFKNISFDSMQLILTYALIFSILGICTRANFKRVALFLGFVLLFQSWTFYTSYYSNKKQILMLVLKTKSSILFHQSGSQLQITSSSDSTVSEPIAQNYQVAQRIQNRKFFNLQSSYKWKNKTILVIDSLKIYPSKTVDYVILSQSPRIHLERLIDSIHPKQIIADGSNYRSYISRWKKTCTNRKLPFHYTGEKGAYYFELEK